MNCQKCNALIPDDSTFCPECGAKVETVWTAPSEPAAQVFCPNCGSPMAAGDCFCENCGAKVEAAAPQQSAAAPKAGKKSKAGGSFQTGSSKTKIPAQFLTLGVAGVALILVVVILVSIIASAGSVNNYALYIKDGEMYYSEMPKGKDPVEVTSKLVDSGSDSNYYLSYNAYSFGNAAYLTKDGKKLFYADKATIGSSGSLTEFTLYYRDITNAKKEPVKITSGISSYSINEKGTLVTYIKDGNLYQHNLKEQTKIASDVTAYRTSKDGKTLLYIEKEDGEEAGTLYKKSGSKEATKIAGDVTRITYVDEKLSTIMFRKDDSLYKKSGNKDAEKIASGIYSVYVTYEDGSLYYATTDEEEELTYWDFITDDMQDDDDYDYYRENLKENTISNSMVTLYYYNGKEAIEVAKNVLDVETGSYDEPVLVYQALEGEDLPKVKLSKVVEDYNAYELISEALADVTEYFVCN